MIIQTLSLHPYEMALTNGHMRFGIILYLIDEKGNESWGEIAPLPKWSKETLEECLQQLQQKEAAILRMEWTAVNCFQELTKLELLPAVSFGLESALLSLLMPLAEYRVSMSALLMGTPQEIMAQAELRQEEGYTSAKLKVSQLSFEDAAYLIHQLKDSFDLRIDVNRAWKMADSLQFFDQFPLDAFDYVEEPFQNPQDLGQFRHPLAVDESFPHPLTLEDLETLPTLKALIYKPTIQGGIHVCLPLQQWALQKGISLVLSSSFESDLGLAHIASMAHRLSLIAPVGIGSYHYLKDFLCAKPLQFSRSIVMIPASHLSSHNRPLAKLLMV